MVFERLGLNVNGTRPARGGPPFCPVDPGKRKVQIVQQRAIGPGNRSLAPDQHIIEADFPRYGQNVARRGPQPALGPVPDHGIADFFCNGKSDAHVFALLAAIQFLAGPRTCLQDKAGSGPFMSFGGI